MIQENFQNPRKSHLGMCWWIYEEKLSRKPIQKCQKKAAHQICKLFVFMEFYNFKLVMH